ncbi:PAN/Apple domain-containing protein [Toxoplasma gondii ME49]|uniref:PAN/Apple domain-containing protein n=1 Tax=Toxoplasma gondii (strain ATCC 50611 / Me49) TaxID=508771 RepID=S8F0R5_TOXGM|nr:PAN/Apple domain-containing protein [Toxoplasma gondii ME49]EPT28202.1 PAN/Apple domain-containing protein [Toxoplasma gondii ME49]|eukprot:XP_002371949.1 PAN/Apple domain-containing protein [Toxoplasma gondii ME49]
MDALKTVFNRRIALPVVVAAALLHNSAEALQSPGLRRQLVNAHSFAEVESTGYSCLEKGKEYVGFSLTEFTEVGDAALCQQRCNQHPQCGFFTFYSNGNRCVLQSRKPSQEKNNANAVSGPKRCPLCLVDSFDFRGEKNMHDNGVPGIKTVVECQMGCAAEPKCKGFLFQHKTKQCHFKTSDNYLKSLHPDNEYVAGPKTCTGEHWCIMKDIGYEAMYTRRSQTNSAEECQNKCLNDEQCQYFTWQVSNKHCWLKHGPTIANSKYNRQGDHSAPKHCGLPTTCVKERTKYAGETVATFPKSEVGTFESCQMKCWKTSKCVFMHFNNDGCTLSGINATAQTDANSKAGDITC